MAHELCAKHDEIIRDMEQTCKRWAKLIDGNGKPELSVRLDRLEQLATVVRWLIGAVVVETLALGANIFLYLLPRLFGH